MNGHTRWAWSARVRIAGREELASGTVYRATEDQAGRAALRVLRRAGAGWVYVEGTLKLRLVREWEVRR